MLFSSPVFLFIFLPLVLAVGSALPARHRNLWLLAASLLFYAWGEPLFVLLMLFSITVNYLLGRWIGRDRSCPRAKSLLVLALLCNLGLLIAFKYGSFLLDNIFMLLELGGLHVDQLPSSRLPLGISFFTFQAISYVVDVFRGEVPAQKRPLDLALYISLFPQLIAGPIVRYHDIAQQLAIRVVTREGFAFGVRRFVIGLGKKMLIANSVAVPADRIFALPAEQLTTGLAWLGVTCYTVQIYFDFSGYSDMAIGLGRMFGFRIPENFNYPYVASSVREFWRRWHISLSTWFRDYLYVPLGGGRRSPSRVHFNLVVVFLLCGLWHGASWNFAVWGLFHGLFLVLERGAARRKWTVQLPALRHGYVLLVVMVGWVFFRCDTLGHALTFLSAMAGAGVAAVPAFVWPVYVDAHVALTLLAGFVGSTPIGPAFGRAYDRWRERPSGIGRTALETAHGAAELGFLGLILFASVLLLAAGTYNPFIYFRF